MKNESENIEPRISVQFYTLPMQTDISLEKVVQFFNIVLMRIDEAGTFLRKTQTEIHTLSVSLEPSPQSIAKNRKKYRGERFRDLDEPLSQFLSKNLSGDTYLTPSSYSISDFPEDVKEKIKRLQSQLEIEDEEALYNDARSIAIWLIDQPNEYQDALVEYLKSMPLLSRQELIATFSDVEVKISSKNLLELISSYLASDNKDLAQNSAICLMSCGSETGRYILNRVLSTQELPCKHLIQGIVKLLN